MTRPTALVALVLSCAFAVSPGAAQPLPRGFSPGTGTIWMGSYSGHLTAVDEATGAATKVPLTTGPPFAVRLSPDRTRFYVQSANMEKFEVVDAVARRSLDTFTLSDARRHVRALTYEVDPQHRSMVIVAQTGWGQDEDRRRASLAGFDFHLTKPVDPAELVATVASLAGRTGLS